MKFESIRTLKISLLNILTDISNIHTHAHTHYYIQSLSSYSESIHSSLESLSYNVMSSWAL